MADTEPRPVARPRLRRRDAAAARRPPGGSSSEEPPADYPPVGFSTLVGPGPALAEVTARWSALLGQGLPDVAVPTIMALSESAAPYGSRALRVAVIHHPIGLGRALVNRLSTRLAQYGLADVTAEEGYYLETAAAAHRPPPVGSGSWSVRWHPEHIELLRRPPRIELSDRVFGAAALGHWVRPGPIGLIDSGDEGAVTQICCRDDASDFEQPWDPIGHGTSVGSLLRLGAPGVQVHSFRVMEMNEEQAASSSMLGAVNEATLKIGSLKVVCIPLRARIGRESWGRYQQLRRIVEHNATAGADLPVVVCAAGNIRGEQGKLMSFPAVVPGFIVALGLDWSGKVANYNCAAPPRVQLNPAYAYGGMHNRPLGVRQRRGSPPVPLYGSSYASALVAAALAFA